MKKIISFALLMFAISTATVSKAQVSLSVNIGIQPAWGPAGYDNVDYYFIPDIDCYYSVRHHRFIYLDNGSWIHSSSLPPAYADFNLYNAYKVVVNTPSPWLHYDQDRVTYAQYRNWNGARQSVIEDHHTEPKYATHYHDDYGHRGVYTHPAPTQHPPAPDRGHEDGHR